MPRFTNCPINFNEYFWHEPREKLKEVRKPSLTIKGITNAWSKSSRSSRPELFCKKGVPRHATLLKKSLWHRCFPVNFVKFLRTPFYIEHLGWLLLELQLFRVSSYLAEILRDFLWDNCLQNGVWNFLDFYCEKQFSRNIKLPKLKYLEIHLFKKISAHRFEEHIYTNKLEEFFLKKIFFKDLELFSRLQNHWFGRHFFHSKVIWFFFFFNGNYLILI